MVSEWLQSKMLVLSADKSTATIFTSWSKEVGFKPEVYINEEKIPFTKHQKHWELPLTSSVEHVKQACEKVQNRNNVLKKLAGTSWGCTKETLSTSYKAIGRSVINYAAPIWTPDVSQSNWNTLQSKQNAALRTVTGCVRMTPAEHLHEETKLKEHNQLLSKQFLVGNFQQARVYHHTVANEVNARNIRASLYSEFGKEVEEVTIGTMIVTAEQYKSGLKVLHYREVKNAAAVKSKILEEIPPKINKLKRNYQGANAPD